LREISLDAPRRRRYVAAMLAAGEISRRYRVSLHRATGCWYARVLDLPGCVARGTSEVEAVERAREMIRSYLWVARVLAEDPATVVLEIGAEV
jgi:predicted RNase H-like HicB family nuclease